MPVYIDLSDVCTRLLIIDRKIVSQLPCHPYRRQAAGPTLTSFTYRLGADTHTHRERYTHKASATNKRT